MLTRGVGDGGGSLLQFNQLKKVASITTFFLFKFIILFFYPLTPPTLTRTLCNQIIKALYILVCLFN
jgi:hypothetical protein